MLGGLALVFEGGGAKGVAYVGALRAIEERNLSIKAVAGASAGAITATLVACGFGADRVEREMLSCLKHLAAQVPPRVEPGRIPRVPWWRRLFGVLSALRDRGAALDTSALRAWLDGLLIERARGGQGLDDKAVTFDELFSVTDVELFVVAANVSRQEQAVFSHRTTPGCQVVDAVLAACGIPGAFASGKLILGEDRMTARERLHTIVDGGVWANYPEFVFKDASFREFWKLDKLEHLVIGFLLEETTDSIVDPRFGRIVLDRDTPRALYRSARFAKWDEPRAYPRTEATLEGEREASRPSVISLLSTTLFLGAVLMGLIGPAVWPTLSRPIVMFAVFGVAYAAYLLWQVTPVSPEKGKGEDDSWPRTRLMRFVRTTVLFLDPWTMLLGVGSFLVILGICIFADRGRPSLWAAMFALVMTFAAGFALVTGVAAVASLSVLKRTLADWGWPLVRTYVAGPGAPPWAGAADGDWVVRVPVPKEVSTFSFDVHELRVGDPENRDRDLGVLEALLRTAQEVSGRELDRILAACR